MYNDSDEVLNKKLTVYNEKQDDAFDWNEFKVKLNNFMVMNAPDKTTMAQAESAMLAMITVLNSDT